MRRATELLLALSIAGCSQPGAEQGDDAATAAVTEEPVLAIVDDGACQARWNRQPVTRETLGEHAAANLQRLITAAGGADRLEEPPTVRVEASGATGWACARPWLAVIERAGFPMFQLVTGEGNVSPSPGFRIPGMAEPRATVTIGAGGDLAWNGDKIDADGLRRRAMTSGPFDEAPPAPSSSMPPPVVSMSSEVLIEADAAAGLAAIRDAIVILRETSLDPVISTDEATAPVTPTR